jgi:putative Mn2+ efflux pump MntP
MSLTVDLLPIFFIALGLSADCFAVAISAGSSNVYRSWTSTLRISLSFGLFQGIMPFLGWLAGNTVIELIEDYDHWVAFGLLTIVSGKMLWESFHSSNERGRNIDITRGQLLIILSVATSIDALAVGLSFPFWQVDVRIACLTIGIVAFLITMFGLLLGNHVNKLLGRRAEIIGAIILLVIAFRILYTHIG